MGIKRHKLKEMVTKLRQVEVPVGQDRCDSADQYCRIDVLWLAQALWGCGTGRLKELKRLQQENEQLRRAVIDLTLDKLILAEVARGNC